MSNKNSKPFDFNNFGNLIFYDDSKKEKYFYFKTLLTSYEMNYPNPEYRTLANNIGNAAVSRLSNIPGLGTEQNEKNTYLLEQLDSIMNILRAAVEQEKANEIRFVENKIGMLKNNFDEKYIKKNRDLAAIQAHLNKLKGEEGIDYNHLIALVNIVEQGYDNSKAIMDFEYQHLKDLDNAVKKNRRALENQIRGLMKTSRYRDKSDEEKEAIVQKSLAKRERIRIEGYLKKHHIRDVPSFKKYMANMTTVDYKIAEWVSKNIQMVLEKNADYYSSILEEYGGCLEEDKRKTATEKIRSHLISAVVRYSADHQAEIINDTLDIIDTEKFCQDLVHDYDIALDVDIMGMPEDFGLREKKLKLFKEGIIKNQEVYKSAEGLYKALEEIMSKIDNKKEKDYSPEEQLIDATLGKNSNDKFYDTSIKTINSLIKKIEELAKLEEKNPDAVSITRDSETKNLRVTVTNKGNTTSINLTSEFSKLGLSLYQKKGYTPQNLSNIITNMKRAAGKRIRDKIISVVNDAPKKIKKDLEKDLEHAFQQIEVVIKGSTMAEILEGLDKTWSIKIWTGRQSVKNDMIEIVVGMPNGENISMALNELLQGHIDKAFKNQVYPELFSSFSETFEQFKKNFSDAIVSDMNNTASKAEYTNYKNMAQRYFETEKTKKEAIRKLDEEYKKLKERINKQSINEEKKRRRLQDVEKVYDRFLQSIKESLYVSSTVKTFTTYQNDIGFIGGDLGANVNSRINSFFDMFAAAGLPIASDTEIKDWLEAAVLNCSPMSVVGEKNKDFIENLLSGLAVFTLFNEGAAEISILKEQIKSDEMISTDNDIMHLYRLNGIYYPGSFVLKNVIKDLDEVIKMIKQTDRLTRSKNVMIYNPANESMVPNRKNSKKGIKKKQTDSDPWGTVAEKVSRSTQIKVLFLAGLLDIMKDLHEKMNVELPA